MARETEAEKNAREEREAEKLLDYAGLVLAAVKRWWKADLPIEEAQELLALKQAALNLIKEANKL